MIFNIDKIFGKISLNNWFNKKNSPYTKIRIKENEVSGDLIGRDKYNISGETSMLLSDLEKKVLKLLHADYKTHQSIPREKITNMFKRLEIKEGTWVAPLNDSKFLKIEGDYIIMNSDGLRFMDNIKKEELDKIVLPHEMKLVEEIMAIQRKRIEENRINYLDQRNSNK